MREPNMKIRITCECGYELPVRIQLTLDRDGTQVMTVPSCERCTQEDE